RFEVRRRDVMSFAPHELRAACWVAMEHNRIELTVLSGVLPRGHSRNHARTIIISAYSTSVSPRRADRRASTNATSPYRVFRFVRRLPVSPLLQLRVEFRAFVSRWLAVP